jgi:hypothetical protein
MFSVVKWAFAKSMLCARKHGQKEVAANRIELFSVFLNFIKRYRL